MMIKKTNKNVLNIENDRLMFYKRRPRRPPFRLVLSDGTGVTSSEKKSQKGEIKKDEMKVNIEPILPILRPDRARARRAD